VMPDTGAPWNIPYVDPTDLVRDYPQASEDLADAIADGLDAAGSAGIGPNVVQTVKTDTFSTTSTSYTAITGMSVTITPSSATSKVLVIANLNIGQLNTASSVSVRLMRDSTSIYEADADGTRSQTSFGAYNVAATEGNKQVHSGAPVFLDSPGVATATTYSVEMKVPNNTGFFNRAGDNPNETRTILTASSITVIEVAV